MTVHRRCQTHAKALLIQSKQDAVRAPIVGCKRACAQPKAYMQIDFDYYLLWFYMQYGVNENGKFSHFKYAIYVYLFILTY